jgi:hypothetical protein
VQSYPGTGSDTRLRIVASLYLSRHSLKSGVFGLLLPTVHLRPAVIWVDGKQGNHSSHDVCESAIGLRHVLIRSSTFLECFLDSGASRIREELRKHPAIDQLRLIKRLKDLQESTLYCGP